MQYFYETYGLKIGSDLVLNDYWTDEHPEVVRDVMIERGKVPGQIAGNCIHRGPNWEMSEDAFIIHVPRVGAYLIEAGNRIVYEAAPKVEDRDVGLFLFDVALPILLHQRKVVALRASAVLVNGKAVLLCGASGTGKSILAESLAQRGHPVLADTCASISLGAGGMPCLLPEGPKIRLWGRALEKKGFDPVDHTVLRSCKLKYLVSSLPASREQAAIGAIYFLIEHRPPRTAGIERLDAINASHYLVMNALRPRLLQAMNLMPKFFSMAAQMSAKSEMYTLTCERDVTVFDTFAGQMDAQWQGEGTI